MDDTALQTDMVASLVAFLDFMRSQMLESTEATFLLIHVHLRALKKLSSVELAYQMTCLHHANTAILSTRQDRAHPNHSSCL